MAHIENRVITSYSIHYTKLYEQVPGTVGGSDAEQADAAQNTWHDRGPELHAARHADAGDCSPGLDGARQPGEYLAPDVVDSYNFV